MLRYKLCAVKGQSQLQFFGSGHRVVTGGLHQVAATMVDGSHQLAETEVPGKFVSMCSRSNLTLFNLSPSSANGVTYVLALISNVIATPQVGKPEVIDVT